jgi:putative phosphoribosyl transferase
VIDLPLKASSREKMELVFRDRVDAGRRLAASLRHLAGEGTVVLGLPRGGVPVAYEVAAQLGAPLDVLVVRKLGVPYQPELAMGAVGEDGVRVLNPDVLAAAYVSESELEEVDRRQRREVERLAALFRGGRAATPLEGRTVVLVDDGIATGSTASAACQVARARGAARVVLAVPVAPRQSLLALEEVADEVCCLASPEPFRAVGQWYEDFTQTTDAEVISLLARSRSPAAAPTPPPPDLHPLREVEVEVRDGIRLRGVLAVPPAMRGMVVFAHGSGSGRHSPRNAMVASVLQRAGLGTLLFDLLTVDEEQHRSEVFDIELLAGRLEEVTCWLRSQPEAGGASVGYFGASTGAGAALCAAARQGAEIAAVVSRGGRPDLAGESLGEVRAPTLLIVGGRDEIVLRLNEQARAKLRCENRLVTVPGATHLFSEPGTLAIVAELARDWFLAHLGGGPAPAQA